MDGQDGRDELRKLALELRGLELVALRRATVLRHSRGSERPRGVLAGGDEVGHQHRAGDFFTSNGTRKLCCPVIFVANSEVQFVAIDRSFQLIAGKLARDLAVFDFQYKLLLQRASEN